METGVIAATLLIGVAAFQMACQHVVHIESEPGAEIFVDGESVGTSLATYTESGGNKSVVVFARKGDRERSIVVPRNDVYWQQIGVGAATGSAACAGLVCGFGVTNILTGGALALPLGIGQCAACTIPFVETGVFWALYGNKLPDVIRVPLDASKQAPQPSSPTPPATAPSAEHSSSGGEQIY